MENWILDAVNEIKDTKLSSLKDAIEKYGEKEVFDTWLKSEGIIGYTNDILRVIDTIKNNR